MRLEDARKPVTSVRPTKDGKWEVVQTTYAQDEEWSRQWQAWWKAEGQSLQEQYPGWWRTA